MASPISCLSILVIPLLVTSLFYHVSNADRALIVSICKEMRDKAFCLSELFSDPQSSTAGLYMLGIITVDLNLKVFEEADSQIPNILASLTDSLDKSRLSNCQTNLANAHEQMKAARNAAGEQSYSEEKSLIMDSFVKVANCSNEYAKPPKRESPISKLTYNIVELFNIANQIIAMIG
ncbi:pectinesterase inhibitor 5-like [Quercus lobata]|uniref:pectinesterase inhibitor 5-like n=1 Tax=Quercus lobata TaxID=97700 RepID=UPI001243F729|nr:pectinesterase inhibitor 5-like [Quercus lobata]